MRRSKKVLLEYIWLDGNKPQQLRSKTKIHEIRSEADLDLKKIPEWAFDGSSTNQAKGNFSDCLLKPVAIYPDPIRGVPNRLVLCEVLNQDGSPHPSNTRHKLVGWDKGCENYEPWFGVEQEYTLFKLRPVDIRAHFKHDRENRYAPLAWVKMDTEPEPQGPYYCGVGADKAFGRPLVEAHLKACLDADLKIWGINSEVMPGQWEFQVGPLPPLELADELLVARWLLHRKGEDYGIVISFSPKPMKGDWNGAGAHTNFSTILTRSGNGMDQIIHLLPKFQMTHGEHIKVYGEGNDKRLTGEHETCDITQFRWGKGDRGASIRIPLPVVRDGMGYFEDRRPAANMDPYTVFRAILETAFGGGFKG